MKYKCLSSTIVIAAGLAAAEARANLIFNLIPEAGTPRFVLTGFNAAAALWSSLVADDITVNIQIGYGSLGPGIIGVAGSSVIEWSYPEVLLALAGQRTSPDDYSAYAWLQTGPTYNRLLNHTSNNPNGPNSAVPYVDTMDRVGLTTANAKALGLLAPDNSVDATIWFNSDLNFDFRHHNPIMLGRLDFVGVAAHEIGHALGFVSGVDDIDTLGGAYDGNEFSSYLLDLYRYSTLSLAAGSGYPDYTADGRTKFFSVDGGATSIAWFSTGMTYGDGRQASHWKDNLGLGIMDPTIAYGERVDIGFNDLRTMDVLGYTIVPEPATCVLSIVSVLVLARRRLRSQ